MGFWQRREKYGRGGRKGWEEGGGHRRSQNARCSGQGRAKFLEGPHVAKIDDVGETFGSYDSRSGGAFCFAELLFGENQIVDVWGNGSASTVHVRAHQELDKRLAHKVHDVLSVLMADAAVPTCE